MSFNDEDVETAETDGGNFKDLYGVRDGALFVIDATPPMFENDPHEGIPYFLQCIRQYKEVLKQKLVWCRQDWMGLILFGTDKGDTNSGTGHILTLQKLDLVSVKDLKEIMEIDEGDKWKDYKGIASTTAYPLHDVLWEAARVFRSVTVTMPIRKVLLFTCQDNPPVPDNEKHRIRVKVQSYNDIDLQLFVVGLGENWNHDVFYKDLEMLSEKIDPDDYERMCLSDIVQQIKLPSRNMAKLPWRLGENVNIDVALCNLCVKREYLKKKSISKATSTPLTTCTYLQTASGSREAGDEESQGRASPVLEMDVRKYQKFGGKNIYFTLAEQRTLCTMRERGIDLICIKPISYHPLYHFGPPYFVVPVKKSNKDKNLLFGALLHKCDARDLMIICAVTIRNHSSPILYTMIPHTRRGGFYLYKIPYKGNVRKINKHLSKYVYNDNPPPTDANGIELFEKMISKLSIEYNPDMFSNPKLQTQQQTIETLALQLEKRDPPPDTTLPNTEEMRERVKDLLEEYDEIFQEEIDNSIEPPKKKRKTAATAEEISALQDTDKIRELAANGEIQKFTVPQIKVMLQKLRLRTSGKKEELINRIKEYHKWKY